jgi:hypothetical protein
MMKTTNILTMTAAVGLVLSLSACGGSAGAEAQATEQCTSQVSDTSLVKPKTLTYATNATLPPMQYMKDG